MSTFEKALQDSIDIKNRLQERSFLDTFETMGKILFNTIFLNEKNNFL